MDVGVSLAEQHRILILGGTGRVGNCVACDLARYTKAAIAVTGRRSRESAFPCLSLDLADREGLRRAIAEADLVVDCAGPFRDRDPRVLETCIALGKNYLDVSDDPGFVGRMLALHPQAKAAGITAILSTGVFPGISNSMARQGVEALDTADEIHLRYLVAGSGGAGVGVMRTTFLELQHPFDAWIDGNWQPVQPYSQREVVSFPPPFHRGGTYWFPTIEAYTLPHSFPVRTVTTKFGSVPDIYNYLTWIVAQLPAKWWKNPETIEFLAQTSYAMTQWSDRFTGIGIAMRAEVIGTKNNQPARFLATMTADNTAEAVGAGTGSLAELVLMGKVQQPGVATVERVLPTTLFLQAMQRRGIEISAA